MGAVLGDKEKQIHRIFFIKIEKSKIKG